MTWTSQFGMSFRLLSTLDVFFHFWHVFSAALTLVSHSFTDFGIRDYLIVICSLTSAFGTISISIPSFCFPAFVCLFVCFCYPCLLLLLCCWSSKPLVYPLFALCLICTLSPSYLVTMSRLFPNLWQRSPMLYLLSQSRAMREQTRDGGMKRERTKRFCFLSLLFLLLKLLLFVVVVVFVMRRGS